MQSYTRRYFRRERQRKRENERDMKRCIERERCIKVVKKERGKFIKNRKQREVERKIAG